MSQRNALERVNGGMGQRSALIVVDVVVGFTDPACPLGSEADDVVQANVELINAFHQAQMPVVLTTVVYHNEEQASVFRARVPALNLLTPDSQWVQFDPRLPIVETDLQLEKRHASSFHGTDLDNWLRANWCPEKPAETVTSRRTRLTSTTSMPNMPMSSRYERFWIHCPAESER